jgi:hypothetical protein
MGDRVVDDGLSLLIFAESDMSNSPETSDLGFTSRTRKNGDVEILHHGRLASTLRGNEAEDFRQEAQDEGSADSQQLMARLTGNYKHGNERQASDHPRNKR